MPFLKAPPVMGMPEVKERDPSFAESFNLLSEAILRGPSPFTAGERELIAAYVSALNGCSYCRGAHTGVCEAFGTRKGLVDELVNDFDAAEVEDRLRAALAYAGKLTTEPENLSEDDVEVFMAAGFDEKALYDVVMVTALFCMSNKIMMGFGVPAHDPDRLAQGIKRIYEKGYAG